MPRCALALLLIAGIVTAANAQQSDPSKVRAKELKAGIKSFRLELLFHGNQKRPMPRLILSVPPIKDDAIYGTAQVTEEQAGKIIDYLADEGFLAKAIDLRKQTNPPQPTMPSYTLEVGNFYEDLGWGRSMLKQWDRLRMVLDGDAAKEMDVQLQRFSGSGLRKQWEREAPSSPANALPWSETVQGLEVALQVDPVTWPLHTQDGKPFPIRQVEVVSVVKVVVD